MSEIERILKAKNKKGNFVSLPTGQGIFYKNNK